MTITNKQIVLANRPSGMPDESTFNIVEKSLDTLQEDQLLVKTLYVSVDPYRRGRMDDTESYI